MVATHNHQPVSQPELSDAEKAVFSLATLNEWRTRQYSNLNQLRADSGFDMSGSYIREFNNSIDNSLDEFLQSKGIDNTSPNYGEVRTLLRDASIDHYTEDEWGNSPASRGVDANNTKSESDKFAERIANRVDTATVNPDQLTDAERAAREAEFNALEAALETARTLWAAESAKRQGRLFSVEDTRRNSLRADYESKLHALGQAHLALHGDYSNEDKNLIAMTILFDEQEKLRNLTTEKLENKKVTKVIQWMNKGGTGTKIAKGMLIGAGAGLAGSFLAGAVGAGIVAGGAVAFTRFARGFALKDADKRGMENYENVVDYDEYDFSQTTESTENSDRLRHFSGVTDESFENDTKYEQAKRRKAAAYGTMMMGAGALIGYGLHFAGSQGFKEAIDRDFQALHPLGEYNIDLFESDGDLNLTEEWSHDGSSEVDGNPGGWPYDGTVNDVADGGSGGFDLPDAPTIPDVDIDPDTTDPSPGTDPNVDNGDNSDIEGDTNDNMNVVTVEAGHGYTHELMDFAEANGQELTPAQAYEMHLALVEEFGDDYINIDGAGNDIYYAGQDIRLSEPGLGRWEQGVPEFSVKYMTDHGLWVQNAA